MLLMREVREDMGKSTFTFAVVVFVFCLRKISTLCIRTRYTYMNGDA